MKLRENCHDGAAREGASQVQVTSVEDTRYWVVVARGTGASVGIDAAFDLPANFLDVPANYTSDTSLTRTLIWRTLYS